MKKKAGILLEFVILLLFFILLFFTGCAKQASWRIERANPRKIVVIKRVPIPGTIEENECEEYFDAVYPDVTKGYIENNAFPYIPKIWLIKGGKKISLIGPEEIDKPPEMYTGEIREFNLPPGLHILHIERWQKLPLYYGGWKKVRKVEIVKLTIAEFADHWSQEHYAWKIVINPSQTSVYCGYRD